MTLSRHLRSFILPLFAAGIIPFFQVIRFNPVGLKIALSHPYLQIPLGALLFCLGLVLLVTTIRMFASIGKGTLAPWDPTRRLVIQSVYAYVRNPMISGVFFMLLGEMLLFGSWAIGAWALIFIIINTLYFKLSEEPGLAERFGQEYLTYRSNVPMWIPRLKPWHPEQEDGQK
jgi:protein-S-isoprenylcysteine O-methyltransferase Ste14